VGGGDRHKPADVLSLTLIAAACSQETTPPSVQTNFTSVPVPLSGARAKLDFE
jgi:hypothetical protein